MHATRTVSIFSFCLILFSALPGILGPASAQQQEKRIALVVGNGAYAKAPLATLDVNGVDLSKQPGHDGGDPSSVPAQLPMPRAAGDLASGAASLPSWAVEPIGLTQRQATARESGEDELTAIKEPKLECGAKARWRSRRARIRKRPTSPRIAGLLTLCWRPV